jgi:hypothetical protein
MIVPGIVPDRLFAAVAAATVLACLLIAALTLIPYVTWRRRAAGGARPP